MPTYGAKNEKRKRSYEFYFQVREGGQALTVRITVKYKYINEQEVLESLFFVKGEELEQKLVESKAQFQEVERILKRASVTHEFENFELARTYYLDIIHELASKKDLNAYVRGKLSAEEYSTKRKLIKEFIDYCKQIIYETRVFSSADMVRDYSLRALALLETHPLRNKESPRTGFLR